MRAIAEFEDGSRLEYDRGGFDDWCVYLTRPGKPRFAPKDVQYFTDLLHFSSNTSNGTVKVYSDFVSLYALVRERKALCPEGHALIKKISGSYLKESRLEVQITFTILFAAMVAEEQKENTRLGCRIKRLGVHQLLMDDPPFTPETAANFSKGKKWPEIAALCQARGF
jgi:hypothetical protein